MDNKEDNLIAEVNEKISQIFKDFMTKITKLEELGALGNRLLEAYRQGLEFLLRPPIEMTSELVQNIVKINETKRLKSYIGAGWKTNHDSIQNITKLNTSVLGLHDHLSKAKSILDELQLHLKELAGAIQTANGCLSPSMNEDSKQQLDRQATVDQL